MKANSQKQRCLALRPISILSSASRIFEKLLCFKLEKIFSANNVITKHQFGFRLGYSTEMASIDLKSMLPLLFSLYINDLPLHTNFHVNLFADDTILILKDNSISHLKVLVNHELKIVNEWMKSNQLSLNYSKTSYFVNYPNRKRSI